MESLKWALTRNSFNPSTLSKLLFALLRYFAFRFQHPHLETQIFSMRGGSDFTVAKGAVFRVGRLVRFMQDSTIRVEGELLIGDNVFFNRGCYISARESVIIGNDCLFGEYVSIHDNNHVASALGTEEGDKKFETSAIEIGNRVWIGAKVTVLPGVRIGSGSIIGANAVVTQSIPARSVAVGVPARVIAPVEGSYPEHSLE